MIFVDFDLTYFLFIRLSERNVIEIVTRLIELGQLEVIYTVDGKEYITPQELSKEIKEELVVHGGNLQVDKNYVKEMFIFVICSVMPFINTLI